VRLLSFLLLACLWLGGIFFAMSNGATENEFTGAPWVERYNMVDADLKTQVGTR
jgi:hypothetical protein